MNIFLTEELLKSISYTSKFTQSLKTLSLRKTPIEQILFDVSQYRNYYAKMLIEHDSLISSRFKSDDSIMRKYEKTLRTDGGFKQCFNDVLGFRIHLDKYPNTFPDYFRVVDLRKGKKTDDGYHAIHLYYQRDSHSYPIEVQLWCEDDYLFNIWSHKYLYKYVEPDIGRELYQLYSNGMIASEEGFKKQFGKLRGGKTDGK